MSRILIAAVQALHILISNPMIRQRVELAIQGAAHRLERAECQKVFTEFEDSAGQPLQARLDALHQTGAGFLTWLRFADGETLPLCIDSSRIAAFTQPGSHVIQICGAVFTKEAMNAYAGEVLVIHELLHSLGLRENPPSSAEINRRVLMRCIM